jgi:hypothetical protein
LSEQIIPGEEQLGQLLNLYNKILTGEKQIEEESEEEDIVIKITSDDKDGYKVFLSVKDNKKETLDKLADIMFAIHKQDVFKTLSSTISTGFSNNKDSKSFKRFTKIFLDKLKDEEEIPLISPIALGISYDKND